MPRAIWKGSVSFGLVQIPVGIYTAEEPQELKFHMLDRRNMGKVGYDRINKKNGENVPWNEIVKGYEVEEGRFVVLTDQDFKQVNVKATQTVDILDFVDEDEVSPSFFDKPYYLAPSSKPGAKAYALLREILKKTKKVGVATVVIRTRQHLALVRPEGNALVLEILRFAHELRSPDELDLPGDDLEELGVTKKELDMAKQLVMGLSEKWDPTRYQDSYRDDLLALINSRAEAGQYETVVEAPDAAAEAEVGGDVVDLMALLKRSLERQAKGREPKVVGHAAPKKRRAAK